MTDYKHNCLKCKFSFNKKPVEHTSFGDPHGSYSFVTCPRCQQKNFLVAAEGQIVKPYQFSNQPSYQTVNDLTAAQQAEVGILKQINANTIEAFRPLWERNSKLNFYEIKKRLKINNIKSYLPDMNRTPILVCGSGPSLEEHFDFIKEYRSKMVVIAVDTAMNPLVKADIYPDFLVNVDPQGDILHKCLKDLKIKHKIPTIMLMSVFTSPDMLDSWTGKVMYYRLFDPENPVYCEQGEKYYSNLHGIPSKLNVGEFTVSLATFFSKYIAYTGIDLAFYKSKYRAEGSFDLTADGDHYMDENVMLVQDYKGDDIYTSDLMLDYSKNFQTNLEHYEKVCKMFHLSKGIVPRPYQLEEFKNYMDTVLAN